VTGVVPMHTETDRLAGSWVRRFKMPPGHALADATRQGAVQSWLWIDLRCGPGPPAGTQRHKTVNAA